MHFPIRRRNILSSFTLWLLVAGLGLAAVQLLPVFLLVDIWIIVLNINVILICLIVVAFVVDCLWGPFPRLAIVVPVGAVVAFLVWYEIQYVGDRAKVASLEAALQSRNTSQPVAFDPAQDVYVTDHPETDTALLYDRIPAIYTPIHSSKLPPFGRFAIRPLKGCNPYSKAQNPTGTDVTHFVGDRSHFLLFCTTRDWVKDLPGVPFVVDAKRSQEQIDGTTVQIATSTLTVSGTEVGRYSLGWMEALPLIPRPVIGCGLVDNPASWQCAAQFQREKLILNGVAGAGTPDGTSPTDMLLKVDHRSSDEIAALTAR